jgi:hypothetical protein
LGGRQRVASYYLGNIVKHARAPLGIVPAAIAVIVVVAFLLYLRKAENRYAARAERAFPGPLEET